MHIGWLSIWTQISSMGRTVVGAATLWYELFQMFSCGFSLKMKNWDKYASFRNQGSGQLKYVQRKKYQLVYCRNLEAANTEFHYIQQTKNLLWYIRTQDNM